MTPIRDETGAMMVGVKIHPDDEAKLDQAIAKLLADGTCATEDECVDTIFRVGLVLAG